MEEAASFDLVNQLANIGSNNLWMRESNGTRNALLDIPGWVDAA